MNGKIASIIKPRFFMIVLTFSLAGVIGLYFYAMSIEPVEVRISEIGMDDVGLTVSTRGYVKKASLSDALRITLLDVDEPDSVLVYVPLSAFEEMDFKTKIVPGAELGVKGEVKEYNGRLEIYVRTNQGLTLVSESGSVLLEIEDLAGSPELFRDLNVTVEGLVVHVEGFHDTYGREGTSLILKDGYYRLNCIAYGSDSRADFNIGATVVFKGTFEYDETELSWHLVDKG